MNKVSKLVMIISLIGLMSSCKGKIDTMEISTCDNDNDATVKVFLNGIVNLEKTPDLTGTTNEENKDGDNVYYYEEKGFLNAEPKGYAFVSKGVEWSNYNGDVDSDFAWDHERKGANKSIVKGNYCLNKNYLPLIWENKWTLSSATLGDSLGGTVEDCAKDNYLMINNSGSGALKLHILPGENLCDVEYQGQGEYPTYFDENGNGTISLNASYGDDQLLFNTLNVNSTKDTITLIGTYTPHNGSSINIEYYYTK